MQRPAFELQLLRAAIAELCNVAVERRSKIGRSIDRRAVAGRQTLHYIGLVVHHCAHLADHARRLRRYDVALPDQHVRHEGEAVVARPPGH